MTRVLTSWTIGVAGLSALAVLALSFGAYPVSPDGMLRWLSWRAGVGAAPDATIIAVIEGIRGPRIAAALLVGGTLSIAGAAYQSLFRNPLVSPDILGVSSGAALGAVLGIFLSLPIAGIQLASFLGGIAAVAAVYAIAAAIRQRDPFLILILAGIRGGEVLALVPVVVIGATILIVLHWRIDVMTLGDDEAKALGVDTRTMRVLVITAATLLTAGAVCFSGIIGWIGLVVPHLARLVVGPSFGRLGPASLIFGAGFLLIVDTLARSAADVEIPLGVLTAIIGTPIFLWLLATARRGWT